MKKSISDYNSSPYLPLLILVDIYQQVTNKALGTAMLQSLVSDSYILITYYLLLIIFLKVRIKHEKMLTLLVYSTIVYAAI